MIIRDGIGRWTYWDARWAWIQPGRPGAEWRSPIVPWLSSSRTFRVGRPYWFGPRTRGVGVVVPATGFRMIVILKMPSVNSGRRRRRRSLIAKIYVKGAGPAWCWAGGRGEGESGNRCATAWQRSSSRGRRSGSGREFGRRTSTPSPVAGPGAGPPVRSARLDVGASTPGSVHGHRGAADHIGGRCRRSTTARAADTR